MKIFLLPDGRARPSWRALLYVIPFLVSANILMFLLSFLFGAELLRSSFELRVFLRGVAPTAALLLTAWLLLRFVDRRSFRNLGMWFAPGWARDLGLGFLLGVLLNTLVVLPLWLAGYIQFRAGEFALPGVALALGGNLIAFALPAAMEELLLRGYIFQRLVDGWGEVAAVIFTSVIFGLLHLGNPAATSLSTANIVLAGVWLAVAYLKTRSLWLPIGLHLAWNYVMGAVYSLPVSGIVFKHRLLETDISGPDWLSGGNFGPEQSVLTVVVLGAATLWLARTRIFSVSPEQQRELE